MEEGVERVVSRFRPSPPPGDPVYSRVPEDGLCLNVFLLISPSGRPSQVLMGVVDPSGPWADIGGMTASRLAALGDRRMLPSRQLFRYESPQGAARTILREQLGAAEIPFRGPEVFSEAWQRPEPAGPGKHWDIHFVFRGEFPTERPPQAAPWKRLEYVDPATLPPSAVGRGHLDVLRLAGFPTGTG